MFCKQGDTDIAGAGVKCLGLHLRTAPLECGVCRSLPERGQGACQAVGNSRALARHRKAVILAWRVRCPWHGKNQELHSHGAAAILAQVCKSPEIFLGRRSGESLVGRGGWNGLKITNSERSFLPSYTIGIRISNTNLNINHFEKTYACKYFSF